jgi:hypothetical protein
MGISAITSAGTTALIIIMILAIHNPHRTLMERKLSEIGYLLTQISWCVDDDSTDPLVVDTVS